MGLLANDGLSVQYSVFLYYTPYLVLDLYREIEKRPLFYNFTEALKKMESVFWLLLSILAGISIFSI